MLEHLYGHANVVRVQPRWFTAEGVEPVSHIFGDGNYVSISKQGTKRFNIFSPPKQTGGIKTMDAKIVRFIQERQLSESFLQEVLRIREELFSDNLLLQEHMYESS